jgi:hypothetical protein
MHFERKNKDAQNLFEDMLDSVFKDSFTRKYIKIIIFKFFFVFNISILKQFKNIKK